MSTKSGSVDSTAASDSSDDAGNLDTNVLSGTLTEAISIVVRG